MERPICPFCETKMIPEYREPIAEIRILPIENPDPTWRDQIEFWFCPYCQYKEFNNN